MNWWDAKKRELSQQIGMYSDLNIRLTPISTEEATWKNDYTTLEMDQLHYMFERDQVIKIHTHHYNFHIAYTVISQNRLLKNDA